MPEVPQTRVQAESYLKELLHEVEETRAAYVPQLRVTRDFVPGRYWFFHPGWSNIRWWWDELISYSAAIPHSIRKLESCYIHERRLEEAALEQNGWKPPGFPAYMQELSETKGLLLDDISSRLFAFREKLAWLAYELVRASCNVSLEHRKVGYHAVKRLLGTARPPANYNSLIQELRKSISRLDDEQIGALSNFRHGFVHNISPRLDEDGPMLLVLQSGDQWDTLESGYRSRHFLHLIWHAWRSLVRATREIGRIELPLCGFKCNVVRDTDLSRPDPYFGLHLGYRGEVELGTLLVTCMKECRGFKAVVKLNKEVDISDKKDVLKCSRVPHSFAYFANEWALRTACHGSWAG